MLEQVELFIASDFEDFDGFIVWADFNDLKSRGQGRNRGLHLDCISSQ
jgi:hypothetical protein